MYNVLSKPRIYIVCMCVIQSSDDRAILVSYICVCVIIPMHSEYTSSILCVCVRYLEQ